VTGGRKAVEQKQDRRISVTGFAIEDIQAVNVDGAVGDRDICKLLWWTKRGITF